MAHPPLLLRGSGASCPRDELIDDASDSLGFSGHSRNLQLSYGFLPTYLPVPAHSSMSVLHFGRFCFTTAIGVLLGFVGLLVVGLAVDLLVGLALGLSFCGVGMDLLVVGLVVGLLVGLAVLGLSFCAYSFLALSISDARDDANEPFSFDDCSCGTSTTAASS